MPKKYPVIDVPWAFIVSIALNIESRKATNGGTFGGDGSGGGKGGLWMVSEASPVVTLPAALVNTARYSWPFRATETLVSVSVVLVAPLMLPNVLPPSVLTCHCTVGVGLPLAATANETLPPAVT